MPRAFNSLSSRNKFAKRHYEAIAQAMQQAVKVLARLAARNAVKQQLRDQGVRMSLVPAREIEERARAYLDANPHLYGEALERAKQMGWIELQPPMVTPDCAERNS